MTELEDAQTRYTELFFVAGLATSRFTKDDDLITNLVNLKKKTKI